MTRPYTLENRQVPFRFPVGQEIYLHAKSPNRVWDPPILLFERYLEYPLIFKDQGMKPFAHLHLLTRLRMC